MRVLSVASEVFPLVKTGGLADVAGALPAALARRDIEMRTLMPGYPAVMEPLGEARVLHATRIYSAPRPGCSPAEAEGLELIVLDAPALFDRPGNPYGTPDGARPAGQLAPLRARSAAPAADIAGASCPGFVPDLVHAHDWQAASPRPISATPARRGRRSLTIHNIAFQGQFPAAIFGGARPAAEAFALEGVEYYGGVGFLKAGLPTPDAITTVSPTYAEEICTPAGGMGLDGLLRARAGGAPRHRQRHRHGVWNPATDPHLAATYTAATLPRRAANKRAIEARFGLDPDDAPLFVRGQPAQLAEGHGPPRRGHRRRSSRAGAQLAVLGSGEAAIEGAFRAPRPRTPAGSASSSATTSRCRTSSRAAATPSWSRRASSLAG